MYFRCATCHGSIWADAGKPGRAAQPRCERCDREYDLAGALGGRAGRTLGARARELARSEQIDLPGAYSALLGLIPLDVVREFGSSGSTVCRTAVKTGDATDGFEFDPEFKTAVKTGQLTARQAFERGSRSAFAQRLMNRHGLTRAEALGVADNRRSLLETIRARDTAKSVTVAAPSSNDGTRRPGVGSRSVAIATVAMLGLVAAGAFVSMRPTSPPRAATLLVDELGAEAAELPAAAKSPTAVSAERDAAVRASNATETEADANGAILRISGPNPDAVLETFCRSTIFFEPIDVRPSVPRIASRRIGVIRDTRNLERPSIVHIMRDETGRWAVGDGSSTVTAIPAPDQLLSHVTR